MRARRRNITVFSISALDLFAASLGAFILIVLVLFPYYRLGGTDVSFEELEDLVKKRRFVASSTNSEMAKIRALRTEIRFLEKQYKSTQDNISEIEAKIEEVERETAEIEIPEPPTPIPEPDPVPKPEPEPDPPRSTGQGLEFSILGLATNKKKIALVVDMSGSMERNAQNVVSALSEILSQMKPDYQFVIIGYRGGPSYSLFPSNGRMTMASSSNLSQAQNFVSRMPREFGGGTPTGAALRRALNLRPGAIILLSDGQPTDGSPASIIKAISIRNRGHAEIHTVAIGNYTQDKSLTLFLQELARRNKGDFVGRAR